MDLAQFECQDAMTINLLSVDTNGLPRVYFAHRNHCINVYRITDGFIHVTDSNLSFITRWIVFVVQMVCVCFHNIYSLSRAYNFHWLLQFNQKQDDGKCDNLIGPSVIGIYSNFFFSIHVKDIIFHKLASKTNLRFRLLFDMLILFNKWDPYVTLIFLIRNMFMHQISRTKSI